MQKKMDNKANLSKFNPISKRNFSEKVQPHKKKNPLKGLSYLSEVGERSSDKTRCWSGVCRRHWYAFLEL